MDTYLIASFDHIQLMAVTQGVYIFSYFSSIALTKSRLQVSPITIGLSFNLARFPSLCSSFWIRGIRRPSAQVAPISSSRWFFPILLANSASVLANEFDGECSIAFLYCQGVIPFNPAAVVLLVFCVALTISFAVTFIIFPPIAFWRYFFFWVRDYIFYIFNFDPSTTRSYYLPNSFIWWPGRRYIDLF